MAAPRRFDSECDYSRDRTTYFIEDERFTQLHPQVCCLHTYTIYFNVHGVCQAQGVQMVYGIYFLPCRFSAWVTTNVHPAVISLWRFCEFVGLVL
ncbi:hypothetical protein ALC53_06873 [Atta colombica]|uniref:Uncharacterized protein n=1 Tax=Atta colombica TaxID=520822 RepID=A0A195BDR5_9HYME|nr:hypothetical protein ALC53_06873 [Atta colombica]